MGKAKVFITGATGTVGLYLTEYLAKKGYKVVAGVRRTSQLYALNSLIKSHPDFISHLFVDITKADNLFDSISGCDVVIHTAAAIEPYASVEYLQSVNVDGTENVLQAAISARAKQFIHLSSLSVITGDKDQFAVDEQQPFIPCREPYANSKIEAEKIVIERVSKSNIEITILRPGFIYGPYERSWMPGLIQAIKKRRAMLVGDTKKQTNVIYTENLCMAIESAILNPKAYGQIYNLTDGQIISKKMLFDTICDELNLPRITLTIPVFAAKLLVETATFITPFMPVFLKQKLSRYSRAAYRLVAVNQGFDISKAERDLGYVNRVPFSEGMAKTLAGWK